MAEAEEGRREGIGRDRKEEGMQQEWRGQE